MYALKIMLSADVFLHTFGTLSRNLTAVGKVSRQKSSHGKLLTAIFTSAAADYCVPECVANSKDFPAY